MRWKQGRQSTNVEDQRGGAGRRVAGGAGILTVIMALVAFFITKDPTALLNLGAGAAQQTNAGETTTTINPEHEERVAFVKTILGFTEEVWGDVFRKAGKTYQEPRLVLFDNPVSSACGLADAAMGPFYCPGDYKVYLELGFFDDLSKRHGAPGDFAQAYVIAHEVGHHVQNLLGISDRVHQQRRTATEAEYNQLSVRLELQADFFAGVWAHHAHQARNILESGDVEEALTAAAAIGDDRLQRQARGYVVPDSFTHGTSAQRVRWFKKGLETGDLSQGDTFNARDL